VEGLIIVGIYMCIQGYDSVRRAASTPFVWDDFCNAAVVDVNYFGSSGAGEGSAVGGEASSAGAFGCPQISEGFWTVWGSRLVQFPMEVITLLFGVIAGMYSRNGNS
jgi:hypothetical protein